MTSAIRFFEEGMLQGIRKSIIMQLFIALALISVSYVKLYSHMYSGKANFIDENIKKSDSLINNPDRRINSVEFQNNWVRKASSQRVEKSRNYDISKCVRINIDRLSEQVNFLNFGSAPDLQELVFLWEHIDRRSTLFQYEIIMKNNPYRQKPFLILKHKDIKTQDIELPKHAKKDLGDYFEVAKFTDYKSFNDGEKQKSDIAHLSFRQGINYSSLFVGNRVSELPDIYFDHKFGIRFGIEAEFILPFKKNKWGVIIEPTFQSFFSEKKIRTKKISGGLFISKINYKSIELPIGLRHYISLNTSILFVDFAYLLDFSYQSTIDFYDRYGALLSSLDIKSRGNIAVGVGYKYRDRYSIEMKYSINREILYNYSSWFSNYNTFSLIFGYSLF